MSVKQVEEKLIPALIINKIVRHLNDATLCLKRNGNLDSRYLGSGKMPTDVKTTPEHLE